MTMLREVSLGAQVLTHGLRPLLNALVTNYKAVSMNQSALGRRVTTLDLIVNKIHPSLNIIKPHIPRNRAVNGMHRNAGGAQRRVIP